MQGLWTKNNIHIGRPLNDGRALLAGHATAHTDQHAFLFEVPDPAQVRENLLLRLLPHRAGVEQNQVGGVDIIGRLIALGRLQHIDHLARVVDVHLAAEGFNEDFFGHGSGVLVRL